MKHGQKMNELMKAQEVTDYLESLRDEKQCEVSMRYFKTGKGEYGENDKFLGIRNPQVHETVRNARDLPLTEVPQLLCSHWHEVRLCAVLILVDKYNALATKRLMDNPQAKMQRKDIVDMYVKYADHINNWDLVDLSVSKILGRWVMEEREKGTALLDSLADSGNLWRERMSMVATLWTMQKGESFWCLRYAEKHLHHKHHLMHKAVGWMLRDLGKYVSMELLRDFLRRHAHDMPRTALRYAIEKMNEAERKEWL